MTVEIDFFKAICLALRQLYLVHKDAIIKMYLECARLYGKAALNQFTGASEPNEKQVMNQVFHVLPRFYPFSYVTLYFFIACSRITFKYCAAQV